jgi:hypothetical protein
MSFRCSSVKGAVLFEGLAPEQIGLRTHQARELTTRGLSMADEVGEEPFRILHHTVLGFVELSLGDPGEALSHLEPLPGELERLGIREPREPGPRSSALRPFHLQVEC